MVSWTVASEVFFIILDSLCCISLSASYSNINRRFLYQQAIPTKDFFWFGVPILLAQGALVYLAYWHGYQLIIWLWLSEPRVILLFLAFRKWRPALAQHKGVPPVRFDSMSWESFGCAYHWWQSCEKIFPLSRVKADCNQFILSSRTISDNFKDTKPIRIHLNVASF
jgi:hypothetical protein